MRNDGVSVASGSRYKEQLEKVFGSFPLELSEEHVSRLQTIHSLTDEEAYSDLIEAIEKHGAIEVYGEY